MHGNASELPAPMMISQTRSAYDGDERLHNPSSTTFLSRVMNFKHSKTQPENRHYQADRLQGLWLTQLSHQLVLKMPSDPSIVAEPAIIAQAGQMVRYGRPRSPDPWTLLSMWPGEDKYEV